MAVGTPFGKVSGRCYDGLTLNGEVYNVCLCRSDGKSRVHNILSIKADVRCSSR